MIQPPEEVPQDAIVTAAQWQALSQYLRQLYLYTPKTVLLSATVQYSSTTATASFSGSTLYWRSGTSVTYTGAPLVRKSGTNSSGFYGYSYAMGTSTGPSIASSYSGSGTYATMPSGTAYFAVQRWPACMTYFEEDWIRDA